MPVPAPPVEREKARAQRERRLEFAKGVPKPKPPRHEKPVTNVSPHRAGYGDAGDAMLDGSEYRHGVDSGNRSRQVDELEALHEHLKASADAIRREMGF